MRRGLGCAVLAVIVVLTLAGCIQPSARWVAPTSGVRASPSPTPTATPEASPSVSVAPVQWTPCPDVWRDVLSQRPANVTFDCAKVQVPRDWARPEPGRTFDIALVRARSTAQRDRVGSLLINPGGPGGSGINYAVFRSISLPAEVTRRFDLIGFDPRGVGQSSPVRCFSDADLDTNFAAEPDPVSQPDFDRAVALARTMAQACGAKYGEDLPLYSTKQAAKDIDAIRVAIGEAKLTYLGYSYGTLLGAVYAQLFPANVRALVLDGAIDPTLPPEISASRQAAGFERAFTNFSSWCTANASQCPIAPDARLAVVGALQDARVAPVRSRGRDATAGWVFTAVIAAMYSRATWPVLATAIADLRQRKAERLFALADSYASRGDDGHYTNLFDANAVVNCADDAQSPTVDRIRTLQSQWRTQHPLFGAPFALGLICAQWPGKRDPYPAGPATGAPPILIIGTAGDPATPVEHATALASMLGPATVLTWQGDGHTAYPKTRCVTEAVNRYLIDLTVPPAGTTCPA